MHQNLTLLVFLCSLYGSAQLYVQKGTTLSLGSFETVLSSQELHNQLDGFVLREGTLVLNRASSQTLTSDLNVLELPNLHLENADFISIKTTLSIQNQLLIASGQLTLSYNLILCDPSALVLGANARICLLTTAHITYETQLEKSHPLALQLPTTLLKYTRTQTSQKCPQAARISTATSNSGSIDNANYVVYCTHLTPPPKVA